MVALGQLSNNPALVAIEDNMHRFLVKLKSLPLSFWRGLIVAVALIWLCRSLATLFWVVFPVPDAPAPPKVAIPVASSTSSASVGQTIDIASLQSKHLFGDSSGVVLDAPQEIPDVSDTAAKTKLKLELSGVLMSSDPSRSSATIANGNNQDIYQIGDVVPGGNNVKLAKVLPDKVILNNSGKFESLWLYTEADFKSNARASSSVSKPSTSKSAGVVKSKVAASRVPKSISEVVRMSVYREEGQMKGYRIRPGRDRELFESLGLKANDIVTSVNGATVDDPQQIRQTYQSLKTATEANLEILRDGETVSINISLDTGE